MLATVRRLLSATISHIKKRPFGSEKTLWIWKLKLLLKRITTPALLLLQQLKSAWYPHSQFHISVMSWEQWTSCSIYIESFFALSQLNTSLLLTLFPNPLTFRETIFRSVVLWVMKEEIQSEYEWSLSDFFFFSFFFLVGKSLSSHFPAK